MTEHAWTKHLRALTRYGSPVKTIIVRCTCPTPADCSCILEDDGGVEACRACREMKNTEPDCMIHVLENWKPGRMKVPE